MKWRKKCRILQVIKQIKKIVKKEGSYTCQVAEIYDSSLRQRTHSFSFWDITWSKDQILSIRYLRAKGYKVEASAQWANSPSYFKGELFYNKQHLYQLLVMEENKGHQKDLERNVFGLSMILAKQLKENQKFTEPDYWEKLKHQYAGMAIQGILSNQNIGADAAYMVNLSIEYANALVEKLKSIEK